MNDDLLERLAALLRYTSFGERYCVHEGKLCIETDDWEQKRKKMDEFKEVSLAEALFRLRSIINRYKFVIEEADYILGTFQCSIMPEDDDARQDSPGME